MQLVVEIGNTNTKIGLFEGSILVEKKVWKNLEINAIQNFCSTITTSVRHALLSFTGKVDESLYNYLKNSFVLQEFTHQSHIPIHNKYSTPHTLGKDRLAAIVALWELYPMQSNMHISAGTCITYDAIDKLGNYYGGSISPGLTMRFKALHHFTARLPLIEAEPTDKWYGDSTESAIRTGVQLGFLAEIRSFIEQYKRYYQIENVILSGGDADFIVQSMDFPFVLDKEIVLKGLNKILIDNAL